MNLTTTLRPSYQLPMFNAIPVALKEYKAIIVQSPAGSGKSVVMSHLVARIIEAHAQGRVPLVLTHRTTIQQQLIKHCQGVSIDSNTDHVFIQHGKCYVAMHQTLIKRTNIVTQLFAMGDKVVVIVDECHYGIFNKMFDALPDAFRIGFSATPAWKWAKHLSIYYNHLIAGPQISTLIAEGSLVNFDYYEMKTNLDGLVSNGKDYTEESQYNVFEKNGLFDGLTVELKNFEGHYKKGAIFCSSIKQCDKVHSTLQEQGFNPVKCHSKVKDANYQKARFESLDQSNLMISVSSLAEGWDFPSLDFEILYRATSSLPLLIQMGMRCSRPSPGKTKSVVLDFGGNNTRFGGTKNLCSMTMDRDWTELWQPPKKLPKGGSPANIKICPMCEFMLHASVRSCSNCGFIYPEAEVLLKQGELVKIEQAQLAAQQAAATLTGQRVSSLTPAQLATWARDKNKTAFAARVAKAKEQKEAGWLGEYGKAMGYKPGWVKWQREQMGDDPIQFADMVVR